MHPNNRAAAPSRETTKSNLSQGSPSQVWSTRRRRLEDRAVALDRAKQAKQLSVMEKFKALAKRNRDPRLVLAESLDRFSGLLERVLGGPA